MHYSENPEILWIDRQTISLQSRKDTSGVEESMDCSGSRTEANLLAAFAGESQARNRYTYCGSVARKSGYEQIGAVFVQTAEEEREGEMVSSD